MKLMLFIAVCLRGTSFFNEIKFNKTCATNSIFDREIKHNSRKYLSKGITDNKGFEFIEFRLINWLEYNNQMGRTSNWSDKENQILLSLIESVKSKKWITISEKLMENGFNRSPSECRERYINYLAPNINKDAITESELRTLYEKYEQFGAKWSIIQKYVKCKTQCKIKNVFYGNIKNLLKTTYKYFTNKTASFINRMKTDELQQVYEGIQDFQNMHQAKDGIKHMAYRNDKKTLQSFIATDEQGFLRLLNTVLVKKLNRNPINLSSKGRSISKQDHFQSSKRQKSLQNAFDGSNSENFDQNSSQREDDVIPQDEQIEEACEQQLASKRISSINSNNANQAMGYLTASFEQAIPSEQLFFIPPPKDQGLFLNCISNNMYPMYPMYGQNVFSVMGSPYTYGF